jgi:exonuclease III
MKIFSWNVNGIRAVIKKGLFQPFLEKYRPDIVCLQETKAERGQFESICQYREYWNSAVKKVIPGPRFSQLGAVVRHQRLSPRVCAALLVCRRAAAR